MSGRPGKRTENSANTRLSGQIDFILEIDKAKNVLRQTVLLDRSRRENVAEHSWHIALMATLLSEYAAAPVDIARVIEMLLAHDLVEIDAGDTMIYDEDGRRDKQDSEVRAAERIFALLPSDQGERLRALWDEYEEWETHEARFAYALDRLQPLLHNLNTEGMMWREHGITLSQVLAVNQRMADGAPALWEYVRPLIEAAAEKGYLAR